MGAIHPLQDALASGVNLIGDVGIRASDGTNKNILRTQDGSYANLRICVMENNVLASVAPINVDNIAVTRNGLTTLAALLGFNGTTWDRLQLDALKNLKVGLQGAVGFNHGGRTTNAATAVALTAASTPAREVTIIAKPANTGYVYIGGSAVSAASYGIRLTANGSISIPISDLNLIYFDVSVNGEGLDFLYTT